MVTNLAYFYESSHKVRGGKWVWVKDSNGEQRGNVLLGGTILNPKKGFDHLYAAQLVQYTPSQGCLIFRSFKVQANAANNATTIYVEGDGYSDAPEVGMYLMIAPRTLKSGGAISVASTSKLDVADSKVDLADATFTVTTGDISDYTGTYAKVTAVVFDETNKKFQLTLENALGAAITTDTILVEGDAAADAALTEPTGSCKVLVPNPNTFVEADRDLLPTEGYGITGTANYSMSAVYNKQAWIARMQPLPDYVLAKNKSYIDGIFWI
jgi:hypothetical protein